MSSGEIVEAPPVFCEALTHVGGEDNYFARALSFHNRQRCDKSSNAIVLDCSGELFTPQEAVCILKQINEQYLSEYSKLIPHSTLDALLLPRSLLLPKNQMGLTPEQKAHALLRKRLRRQVFVKMKSVQWLTRGEKPLHSFLRVETTDSTCLPVTIGSCDLLVRVAWHCEEGDDDEELPDLCGNGAVLIENWDGTFKHGCLPLVALPYTKITIRFKSQKPRYVAICLMNLMNYEYRRFVAQSKHIWCTDGKVHNAVQIAYGACSRIFDGNCSEYCKCAKFLSKYPVCTFNSGTFSKWLSLRMANV